MKTETILEKLKEIVEEWENFECSNTPDTDIWCSATEDAIWSCAEKINDLIDEIEEENSVD